VRWGLSGPAAGGSARHGRIFEILFVQRHLRSVLGCGESPGFGHFGHVSPLRRNPAGIMVAKKDAVGLDTLTPFMHSSRRFWVFEPLSDRAGRHSRRWLFRPDTVRIRSGNPSHPREPVRPLKDGFGDGELPGQTVYLKDEEVRPWLGRNRRGELRPFRVSIFPHDSLKGR